MDARHLWSVYSRFGFGMVAGTGFPGESAGVLRDHERWRKLEQATLAYGYGLSVTPLQLARAMAAIADGGRLREPTFIANAGNSPHSVLDPDLARQLAVMLETVTGPEGTGSRARVEGYRVAGKTGTSRKAASGSYADRYIGSCVGFAPVSAPELGVAVIINDPDGDTFYGGQVAAPLFSQVLAAGLRLLDVPPADPELLMAQLGGGHEWAGHQRECFVWRHGGHGFRQLAGGVRPVPGLPPGCARCGVCGAGRPAGRRSGFC